MKTAIDETEPDYSIIKNERFVDLLKNMMCKNQEKRFTIDDVLNHDWLGLEQQTGNGYDVIIEEESNLSVSQAGPPNRKASNISIGNFNLRLPQKRETKELSSTKSLLDCMD